MTSSPRLSPPEISFTNKLETLEKQRKELLEKSRQGEDISKEAEDLAQKYIAASKDTSGKYFSFFSRPQNYPSYLRLRYFIGELVSFYNPHFTLDHWWSWSDYGGEKKPFLHHRQALRLRLINRLKKEPTIKDLEGLIREGSQDRQVLREIGLAYLQAYESVSQSESASPPESSPLTKNLLAARDAFQKTRQLHPDITLDFLIAYCTREISRHNLPPDTEAFTPSYHTLHFLSGIYLHEAPHDVKNLRQNVLPPLEKSLSVLNNHLQDLQEKKDEDEKTTYLREISFKNQQELADEQNRLSKLIGNCKFYIFEHEPSLKQKEKDYQKYFKKGPHQYKTALSLARAYFQQENFLLAEQYFQETLASLTGSGSEIKKTLNSLVIFTQFKQKKAKALSIQATQYKALPPETFDGYDGLNLYCFAFGLPDSEEKRYWFKLAKKILNLDRWQPSDSLFAKLRSELISYLQPKEQAKND